MGKEINAVRTITSESHHHVRRQCWSLVSSEAFYAENYKDVAVCTLEQDEFYSIPLLTYSWRVPPTSVLTDRESP